METNQVFTITAGNTHDIMFAIPRGNQTDPFTISLGAMVQSYADYDFPISGGFGFVAGANETAPLTFALNSVANNNFSYLTSISLIETVADAPAVPLPASGLLLGSLGALALRRRPA